jgi:hypothetical protein
VSKSRTVGRDRAHRYRGPAGAGRERPSRAHQRRSGGRARRGGSTLPPAAGGMSCAPTDPACAPCPRSPRPGRDLAGGSRGFPRGPSLRHAAAEHGLSIQRLGDACSPRALGAEPEDALHHKRMLLVQDADHVLAGAVRPKHRLVQRSGSALARTWSENSESF